MKITNSIFLVLFILSRFASCTDSEKHDKNSQNQLPIPQETAKVERNSIVATPITQPAERAPSIPTNLEGKWVNTAYVDDLRETKSPKDAQKRNYVSMIYMPAETNQAVTIIYSFHEGVTMDLISQSNVLKFERPFEGNLSSELYFKNDTISADSLSFIRMENTKIAERFLFAGVYNWDNTTVDLTPEGMILGHDSLQLYEVRLDYYDVGLDVDQLNLYTSRRRKKTTYGFNFVSDTLNFYELNCVLEQDDDCMKVENGKLIHQLIKIGEH